jgi:Na+/melibiose symporter-like transporter
MIITCKKKITFLWIVLATLPWVAVIFKDKVMAIAFTFSMRKFVENPAALTFLLTVPMYISWIVPPTVNFMADRIWTRWGRRKPFIVTSWIGTMVSITLMPLAPDFGWLLAAYTVFHVFNAIGGPVESLKMEIVPPSQRGTSAAVMSWIAQLTVLLFWVVAIGRFDEMTTMFGFNVSGEQGLFWTVSLGMVIMLLFLMLGIKETNPHSALLGEKYSFRTVFGGLFNQHLWPVYILIFSVAILGTGMGAFNQLLITEQWGYSKQDQGNNIAIGGIINLFLIPMLGLLANKVGRGRVYVSLVIAGITVNTSMFLYYTFVLYDARPSLIEMIVFGEMLSVIGILTGMSLTPFQYDFIPRNELGTFAAGSGLVISATNILTTNLMGLFVWGYATIFLGPPGEMARVTFQDNQHRAAAEQTLAGASWVDPATGSTLNAPHLTAQPWYATGAKLDHGRGYEIRLNNKDSSTLRDQRDQMDAERGKHKARKSYAINKLAKNPPALEADKLRATVASETAAEMELTSKIDKIDQELAKRASAFRTQIEQVLGTKLMRDGDQILAVAQEPAVLASFALNARPIPSAVEQTLDRLHKAEGSVIDLRVIPSGDKWILQLSARTDDTAKLKSALEASATPSLKQVMNWPPATPEIQNAKAVRLDLRIIEDPLDRHTSPIMRMVYGSMAIFTDPPTPEQRLNALGRNLRRPGVFEHAGANVVPGEENAIRIMAIPVDAPSENLDTAPAVVTARLSQSLDPVTAKQAVALYAATMPAAKAQRMTIAQPILITSFAKQQYDYMAGYIAVFVLQLVGLGITFFFLYLVKIGRVRRRGAEEAEAIA